MSKINRKINPMRIPQHVAFIMDGNGRWANRRGLPRSFGHRAGYKKTILAVKRCADLGIKVVSIYAFSTENWGRPKDEIDTIFGLIRDSMDKDSDEFMKHKIKVIASGDTTRFPQDLQDKLAEVIDRTKNNTRCTFNICANYGGRADILCAVNNIMANCRDNASPDQQLVTEQDIESNLYTANLPPLDLIVRTSGEQRISNFMLWQMAYSEFLFIKSHWPAINEKIIDKCIIEFQKRDRRFGKV